jgi:hypothetical protein
MIRDFDSLDTLLHICDKTKNLQDNSNSVSRSIEF